MTEVLDQADAFSPESLALRLGPELYAAAVASAMNAPAPSPAKVEAVQRILARSVNEIAQQQSNHSPRTRLSRAA